VFGYEQAAYGELAQPIVATGQLEQSSSHLVAAIRLMESHLDEPISIPMMAKRIGISTRALEKHFARNIGQSPAHFYLDQRLAAARKMVTDTKLSMTEIAARTGFSSASVFTRTFRARFERTPTSLR
jgi:AraC family transcriptional regulator, glycine betaine-responsive activator